MNPLKRFTLSVRAFAEDARAAVTVELVLVVPMLIWAFFATMIFNDAYRARTQAQAAALHVADAISRNTAIVTTEYLEGMNDVYDFLIADGETSRLRITSVVWDRDADQPLVLWSYGTRGMNALPDNTFQLMSSGDMGTLRELMDGEDGENMIAGFTQMPNTDLHNRIPPVMPGEALILVESFTMWETPLPQVFLGFDILNDTRLSPIAVVRPRFSPFINFEGAMDAAPPDASEFDGTPADPVSDPDDPDTPGDDPADPDDAVDVTSNDFTNGTADGWSSGDIQTVDNDGSGGAAVGAYLGPFGNETRNAPVTFTNTFSQTMEEAVYEFDLVVLGSWDGYYDDWAPPEGEALMLLVNGETVAFEVFANGAWGPYGRQRQRYVNTASGRLNIRLTLVDDAIDYDANGWTDQLWTLRLEVVNPADRMEIGFSANTSEPVYNEGFGISAIRLNATPGAHDPNRFVPDVSTSLGADSLTGFQTYEGCFSRSHPAPGLTLTNSDLWGGPIRMLRNVGGENLLNDCNGQHGPGYIKASPTVKFRYENDTGNWRGNRLRIRTDDGEGGWACDATILVRDPNGQFMFVDDLWPFGYNAGLELGHAQDGLYTIWVGNWRSGECQTDLVFEHY